MPGLAGLPDIFNVMLKQIIIAISALKISKDFILRYRLWENWRSMRWIHYAFVMFAIFFGIKMFGLFGSAFSNLGNLVTGNMDQVQLGFTGGFMKSDFSFFDSDMYKYLFLFFSMSLVFHFGGRTMEVLYRVPYRPTFKIFIHSQVRSFLMVLVCYILESIISGVAHGLLSAFSIGWFHPVFKFMIQSFFFGAVIIDGLHEARGWSFKASIKHSLNYYSGIALLMGAVGLALSYVPVFGALVVGSIISVGTLIAIKRMETTSF